MKSLDPKLLEIPATATQTVQIGATVRPRSVSRRRQKASAAARVQMTVRLGDETDAFEDVIPVEILASPETVAAYGEARHDATAKETVPIRPASCQGSAACMSSCRRRRWSASARARAIWSSIRMGARSNRPRAHLRAARFGSRRRVSARNRSEESPEHLSSDPCAYLDSVHVHPAANAEYPNEPLEDGHGDLAR